MEITKEQLAKRREVYEREIASLRQQIRHGEALIDSFKGAINDIDHWLKVLDGSADAAEE